MDMPNGIESKFRYILISAKRARQLQAGARPQVQPQSRKATKIAQQEVGSGLIPFEIVELKTEPPSQPE